MPTGVYARTKPAWNKGVSTPGNKCPDGCSCGRHRTQTPEERARRRDSMMGKNVGKKYGPPSDEHREKNRQSQLGNQKAKGIKHTPEQRAAHAKRMRQRWSDGTYDHLADDWSGAGEHAGVWMRCLNSEGVFARDCDDVGIAWLYEPRRFKLSWCTYLPDFYLPEFDVWVEVKGWGDRRRTEWQHKVESFRRETGKTLVVVYQTELSALTYKERG